MNTQNIYLNNKSVQITLFSSDCLTVIKIRDSQFELNITSFNETNEQ